MMKYRLTPSLLLATLLAAGAARGADLPREFAAPPGSAKPLTWWHWIDGNVTRGGITRDLEAMKRAGLGGCYLFSIGGFFPQGPAKFGQEEWYDLLGYTVKEAERLGLVFGVHNCDGWSEAGGPWITPETSMKELTHASVDVAGPTHFAGRLVVPPIRENFYRDIAVVAYRVPAGERVNGPATAASVTGSIGASALKVLADGNQETRARFPKSKTGHEIVFDLGSNSTLRTMVLHNVSGYTGDEDFPAFVEASGDGQAWRRAGSFCFSWDTADGVKPITVGLGELRTRYLRISFTNLWDVEIGEVELTSAARLHFAEAKAGTLRCRGHGGEARNFANYPGPERQWRLPADCVVAARDVVDLTAKLDPSGHLEWQAPAGHWRILRVGFTSNGRSNKPATVAGRGLECDKLDARVVRSHLDQYVGQLVQRFGPAVGKTFAAVETDSWECDVQNWTAGLEQRLQQRTGIDIRPWLPLLIEGWIVDSPDASERMLWDWRRFLADQFAENFFGEVSRYLREKHLTYVIEGSGRQMYLYDPIGYQRPGDVPMGEFWLNSGAGQGVRVDNKVAASTAHITGGRIVASESYTASATFAKWQNHPYTLKPLGDRAFCGGVNRFVFHTFAHQPYEVTGPGFSMAVWGLNCNRANTWWEQGRAWMEYLTRCNYLLQEGRFVADVLWYIGDDVPNRIGWANELKPALARGHDFDACDAKALLEARVEEGRIVLPSGMSYRVLLLANRPTMRPAVLRKIAELAEAGAVIVGPPPQQSPSLADLGDGDRQVRELAQQIWGPCDGVKAKENAAGKGHVYWGMSFDEIFQRLNLAPDFLWRGKADEAEVLYIHRRIGDTEAYFVSNQKPRVEPGTARFRVTGRQPELWDPATGAITRPAVFRSTPDGTELELTLDPAGSVFVLFREPAPARHVVEAGQADISFNPKGKLVARTWQSGGGGLKFSDGTSGEFASVPVPAPIDLAGPWDITFPPKLGAPSSAKFPQLVSWSERPEDGIRYFSGTATYTHDFTLAADKLGSGREVWLDLGDVQVIAEVRLNGQDLGVLWKPPFRLNATAALKPGANRLEVRVTNLWPNRMIGDEQLPDTLTWTKTRQLPSKWPAWLLKGEPRPDGRITFCTRKPFKKNDALLPSGLLGPVRLVFARTQEL